MEVEHNITLLELKSAISNEFVGISLLTFKNPLKTLNTIIFDKENVETQSLVD